MKLEGFQLQTAQILYHLWTGAQEEEAQASGRFHQYIDDLNPNKEKFVFDVKSNEFIELKDGEEVQK